ncbi:MAG: TetR/AcrR family transcriptional regulator [Pseudomonadota bacterium]
MNNISIIHILSIAAPMTANRPITDARERILQAAEQRFLAYGYHKTTMAEIANDVSMSTANLYRYFRNKQAIAFEVCGRWMSTRLERLQKVVASDRRAREKLEAYALTMVEHTHELASGDSMIGQLVDIITRENAAMVLDKVAAHQGLLQNILDLGVADGEFDAKQAEGAAASIYSALVVFDVPLFVGLLTRDDYDRRARGLTKLLCDSLSTPTHA